MSRVVTEGTLALREVLKRLTQDEVAQAAGRGRALVSRWSSAERCPSVEMRARLEELYGLPVSSWERVGVDRPPAAVAPVWSRPEAPSGAEGDPDRGAYQRALEHAQLTKRELEARRGKASPRELATLMQACTAANGVLGRLELDESKIINSPAWSKIEATLLSALEPFPEACHAAAEALRTVRESRGADRS